MTAPCLTIALKLWLAMVPVIGTVVRVGPVELGPDNDTTYESVIIREEAGAVRCFLKVRAVSEISGLVEPDATGTFLFWTGPTDCRLLFLYRANGARAVDFDAVLHYFNQP